MFKLKKLFVITIAFIISAKAFSLSHDFIKDYPDYFVYCSAIDEADNYEFVCLYSQTLKSAKFLCINLNRENDTAVLLETDNSLSWFSCALIYSETSETVYFYINGSENENGIYNYQGLYSCKKTDGKFLPENINRYFLPEDWMFIQAINFYILQNRDYKGFLNYIYSFSDNCEKQLCVTTENGELLTDTDALIYLLNNNLLYSYTYNFLHTYIKRVENGQLTEKSAYTVNGNPQLVKTILKDHLHDSYFLKSSEGIWIINAINREDQKLDENENIISTWVHDYYKIYLLEDESGKIAEKTPDILNSIQFYKDEEDIKKGTIVQNDYLLLPDKNSSSVFAYRRGVINTFDSYSQAVEYCTNKNDTKIENSQKKLKKINKTQIPYFIAAIFAVLLIIELIYIFYSKSVSYKTHLNKKDKKLIFKIQDEERSKVSKDIHDSVVQNIRAIRLEAEMLEVQESSSQRKEKIIEEMTNVISLLRNICYNLSPAELSLAENMDSTNVELLSVIDTLSKQFTAKTKIPCSISLEKGMELPVLDVEVSKNVVRVVQECFANIEKHSFATRVQILVKNEIKENTRNLIIFIIDDGIGCEVKNLTSKKTHFGIRNMIERMNMIGGNIEFFSEPNEGLNIQLQVPYESSSK